MVVVVVVLGTSSGRLAGGLAVVPDGLCQGTASSLHPVPGGRNMSGIPGVLK